MKKSRKICSGVAGGIESCQWKWEVPVESRDAGGIDSCRSFCTVSTGWIVMYCNSYISPKSDKSIFYKIKSDKLGKFNIYIINIDFSEFIWCFIRNGESPFFLFWNRMLYVLHVDLSNFIWFDILKSGRVSWGPGPQATTAWPNIYTVKTNSDLHFIVEFSRRDRWKT